MSTSGATIARSSRARMMSTTPRISGMSRSRSWAAAVSTSLLMAVPPPTFARLDLGLPVLCCPVLRRAGVPVPGGDTRIRRVTGRPRGPACHVVLLCSCMGSDPTPRKYDVSRCLRLSSYIQKAPDFAQSDQVARRTRAIRSPTHELMCPVSPRARLRGTRCRSQPVFRVQPARPGLPAGRHSRVSCSGRAGAKAAGRARGSTGRPRAGAGTGADRTAAGRRP
jgi:hypothetical protein